MVVSCCFKYMVACFSVMCEGGGRGDGLHDVDGVLLRGGRHAAVHRGGGPRTRGNPQREILTYTNTHHNIDGSPLFCGLNFLSAFHNSRDT